MLYYTEIDIFFADRNDDIHTVVINLVSTEFLENSSLWSSASVKRSRTPVKVFA